MRIQYRTADGPPYITIDNDIKHAPFFTLFTAGDSPRTAVRLPLIEYPDETPTKKARDLFLLGVHRRGTLFPFIPIATCVLTKICGLQIDTFTIPQCGVIQFTITPQSPVLPIPPYSVIAYPRDGIPSVYPLALTGQTAPWTVVYPAGWSHSAHFCTCEPFLMSPRRHKTPLRPC